MKRNTSKQSEHDNAIYDAQDIYEENGKTVWINPDGEKNKRRHGFYIDIIVASDKKNTGKRAWVIELETKDSVSDEEAEGQWEDYAEAYDHWFLAVPSGSKQKAKELLEAYDISNCTVITWKREADGRYSFWGLPGLK